MRRTIVIASIAALFVFGESVLAQQQNHGWDKDWSNSCREMMDNSQHMMRGQGMMGGMGMMGRGMMNGMMDRMHSSNHHRSDTKLLKPLDKKGAIERVQEYVESLNNPRLKLGDVREDDDAFVVDIVTNKENAVVERVRVEKDTGELSPVSDE